MVLSMRSKGHWRGNDTSEDDAEYEEDDEIPAKPRTRNLHVRQKGNLHMLSDSNGEDIYEDIDDTITSDDGTIKQAKRMQTEKSRKSESSDNSEEADEKKTGVVKLRPRRTKNRHKDSESLSDEDSNVSMAEDDISTGADTEEQWHPVQDEEDDMVNPNRCIFCHLDEHNDPSEDFETYLACATCGDNAHRQCARDARALQSDDEGDNWYCFDCVSNNLIPENFTRKVSNSSVREDVQKDKTTYQPIHSHQAADSFGTNSSMKQPIASDHHASISHRYRKRRNSLSDSDAQDTNKFRRRTREKVQGRDKVNIKTSVTPNYLLSNGLNLMQVENSQTRISRSQRPKPAVKKLVRIVEKTSTSLKIAIKVDAAEVAYRLSRSPRPKRKKRMSAGPLTSIPSSTFVTSTLPQSFYSLHNREYDETKSKPYCGILTEEQADTTITLPKPGDRRQFDEARQKAEEEWKARVAAASEAAVAAGIKKPRKISGPASQIEYIEFGNFQIDVWYAAPYPEEYSRNTALFICEFCLKYMESDIVAWRHTTKCPWKNPPGDEIYRDGPVAVFEVDGRKNPLYCQNLCLLAKLFLGSKTLYYDVEPFLFYVMTEYDQYGYHFVGYFSKEKRPSSLNNVSCILVLPIHQRKGYGHLLIDFSYLLTRVEKKTGSPEKPLSDMGLVSYRSYWRLVLCTYLKDFKAGDKLPSIRKISDDMGLTPDDVISALDALGTLIRDPVTGTYAMKIKPDYYREVVQRHEMRNHAKLNPKALFWTPYVMGRGTAPSFEYLNRFVTQNELEDKDLSPTQIIGKSVEPHTGENEDAEAGTISPNKIFSGKNSFSTVTPERYQSMGLNDTDCSKAHSYYEAAASIPPTRFEVFPPPRGTRGRGTTRGTYSRSNTSRKRGSFTNRFTESGQNESSLCSPSVRGRIKSGQRRGRGAKRCTHEINVAEISPNDQILNTPFRSTGSRLGTEMKVDTIEELVCDQNQGELKLEDKHKDVIMDDTPNVQKWRELDLDGDLGLVEPSLEKDDSSKEGKDIDQCMITATDNGFMEHVPFSESNIDLD